MLPDFSPTGLDQKIDHRISLSSGKNRLKLRVTHPSLAILLCSALLVTSCKIKKSETALVEDFRNMDTFFRTRPFRYDSMKILVARVAGNFVHAEDKKLTYDARKATVSYQWNSDSSITFLNANKIFHKGFSREVIIHAGDSILFIHRFSTEPLGTESRENFTFLEEIFYMTDTGIIKHLARISYRQKDLKDTLAFRKKPFADLTDDISHYYSLELSHSRNILSLN